ncbi:ATP-binding protein [Pseudomonas aeruginosa]
MRTVNQLDEQVRRLSHRDAALQERYRIAQEREQKICEDIGHIDTLLTRKDDTLRLIHKLTLRAQAKNKGVFEDMLTALVNDVMPGKIERVVLTSVMKNNRANLEIDAISGGELMNIDDELGGSISNLVAMGLRFIVLARHPNRRVLFLDESDCHIKEDYTSGFARFMQHLSQKMGIQVVYISHSPARHFNGYGKVFELTNNDKSTKFRVICDEPEAEEDYEAPSSALRYLRLKDYGPHANVLVELSPRLNIITGDNNAGKSKFIQSVIELCENKAQEKRIKRGRPMFEVEIGIEEGMSVQWTYKRTGKEKTYLGLFDSNGAVIHESKEGGKIPDWLHTYLAMKPVNGQEINFQSQKKQNFILSSEFTSGERAQMLPLGRESRDVMAMNQKFNERVTDASKAKQSLLKELNRYQNELAILSLIVDNPIDHEYLREECVSAMQNARDQDQLQERIKRMEKLEAQLEILDDSLNRLERAVLVPVTIVTDDRILERAEKIEQCQQQLDVLKALDDLPKQVEAPVPKDLKAIAESGARIRQLSAALEALNGLETLPEVPKVDIKDTDGLAVTLEKIEKGNAELADITRDLAAATAERVEHERCRQQVIDELGGICPTCCQPMEEHSHD